MFSWAHELMCTYNLQLISIVLAAKIDEALKIRAGGRLHTAMFTIDRTPKPWHLRAVRPMGVSIIAT